MSKKKRPQTQPAARPVQLPVMHGDCFRTFVAEATSIGNELEARRSFCADVIEYLQQKGLRAEWDTWREAKHAPKT